MHDNDVSQTLYFAESDFLTALESDEKVLAPWHQTWSALLDDLSSASENRTACNESSLVHFVASRISNIASCYLHVKHEEEDSSAQLHIDFDAMLHWMGALNLNAQSKSSHSDGSPDAHFPALPTTQALDTGGSSSPFPAPAYQWFLDNLHNPYPTVEVKARIAAASAYKVSSVNSWFINTRRRIGWTALCRERFSNCRTEMLDAAYRALVEEDPQRALSPDLRHSFIAIKVAAESLYSSTFAKSAFAGDLDAVVKDVTEKDGESAEVEKCRQVEQANLTKVREIEVRRGCHVTKRESSQAVQDSYPSPNPSITASPMLVLDGSLTDESGEEEDVTPPIIAGSKRRLSSMEPVDEPSSMSRPTKRLRASMTSRTCLPSPSSSTDGIDGLSDHSSPELSPVHSTPPETNKALPSRKRRLSDTDATGIPKRPSDSMATPRLHTASDPLPRLSMENEYSIDDWFKTNFDDLFAIPPPVDATEPDFSVSWEVELFKDYSIPSNPKCVPKCAPAPADIRTFVPSNLSDPDSLLQSIGGDTSDTSSDSALLSSITGAVYTAPLDSSIPTISQTSIDWTSLLNGIEAYHPVVYSSFPQYFTNPQPLPNIDLSMLQLPQVMPAVHSQGDFASKQAKIHQLHAMQEAVWRMEQELRTEGVVI